jgi:hypothetical protein
MLGGAALVFFDCGEALIEGKGLLNLFETLNNIVKAYSNSFFMEFLTLVLRIQSLIHRFEALFHASKLSAHLPQLRRKKILHDLTSFLDDAHDNKSLLWVILHPF